MKASEFKQLIKEAVREAIKEELLETVQQPVSQPAGNKQPSVTYEKTGNAVLDALNETRTSMTSDDYRNVMNANSSMAASFDRSMFMPKQNIKPASDDPAVVAQAIASAPKTGIDISQLGFVNKAAAIVNVAAKKDKERFGG